MVNKKNVLFVVDERRMGGVSILLSDILHKINLNKYNIDVLVLHDDGDYLEDLPKEVNVFFGTQFFMSVDYTISEVLKSMNLKRIFAKTRLVLLMKTKRIGKRIIKERKKILKKQYDVEITFKDGFCALFTAYGDSLKKYHWLHADYRLFDSTSKYHDLFQEIYPRFDKIIGISNGILEHFKEKYEVNKTDVIYNLIDVDKVINKSNEKKIKFDNNELNLVAVGRLHPVKGYDRLIEAFHRLDIENKLKNVKMRIIGDGPMYEILKNKIKEYHLEDKILLLGRMTNPYPYLKASDMFIMCSTSEGYPLVLIESLILHVPIFSLRLASIDEIMKKGYGLIYENDEENLYKGLLEVINNKNQIDKYKDNLKDYNYDTKKIINQIEKLLDE